MTFDVIRMKAFDWLIEIRRNKTLGSFQLREPDDPDVGDDQVRDSNRVMLSNALKQQGFPVVDMGIVNGGPTALKDTIQRAYEQGDAETCFTCRVQKIFDDEFLSSS